LKGFKAEKPVVMLLIIIFAYRLFVVLVSDSISLGLGFKTKTLNNGFEDEAKTLLNAIHVVSRTKREQN